MPLECIQLYWGDQKGQDLGAHVYSDCHGIFRLTKEKRVMWAEKSRPIYKHELRDRYIFYTGGPPISYPEYEEWVCGPMGGLRNGGFFVESKC